MNKQKQNEKQQVKNNLIKYLTDGINNQSGDKQNDMLSIELLIPYADHPFKLYGGKRFSDMVRSIKELGVLLPIIVRPFYLDDEEGERYEILSGHNRVNAAREAGLTEIPAIIKRDLSDDEAKLIVTETNLVQRSFADLLHSEKAVALKHHMDAIKHQGKRTDLIAEIYKMVNNHDETEENNNGGLIATRLKSRDLTASKYGLDSRSVSRYLRLCELNKSLLDRVDSEEIGLYAAVSISYLTAGEQRRLNEILDENKYKIDIKKAGTLRSFSENAKLSNENIVRILSGRINEKGKLKTPPSLKIKHKIYSKYFHDDTTKSEMEYIIDKALEEYFYNRLKI